jgi:Ca2+-binding EF-hand superfamily protein
VITYLLLSGETPFGGLDGESLVLVKNNIIRGKVVFKPKEIWDSVSDAGKAFVKRMLHPDPKLRPTARELQLDPWIQIWAKKGAKEGDKLNSKTVDALIAFKESSEMQKLLSEILSFTLQPEQIIELRKEFEKIDEDGDGEISLTAMQKVLMRNAGAGTLGTLEEHEVEEIFESIKIRKAAPTLRWHEFLAAGLSQAKVDDRNLRLAFDRLDSQRKGFLTLEDLSEVLGGSIELKDLEIIWLSSLKDCKAHPDRITFADFKALMNGRPKMGATAVTPLDVVMEQNRPENGRDVPRHGDFDTNEVHHVQQSSSRSHSQKSSNSFWDGNDSSEHRTVKMSGSGALLRCEEGNVSVHFVDANSNLLATKRDLFRKRLEMRLAVMEASKRFDNKLKDMNRIISPRRAGLIMKRVDGDHVEDEFAPLRSIGRNASTTRTRPDRKKTVSDVTGLFK